MQSGKAHINYQVNKKKITNTKKMQEAIKATVALLKRASKEGLTAWIKNAIKVASGKMKRYNVSMESIEKEAGVKIKEIKVADTTAKKTYTVSKAGEGTTKRGAKTTAKKTPAKKEASEKKTPTKKATSKKEAE